MAKAKDCPKCAGAMVEGFVADQGHGIIVVPRWTEGPPKKSVWVGVQPKGRARSEVSSWRCRRCGFLESYAELEPDLAAEAQEQSQAMSLLAALVVIAVIVVAAALLLN